MRLATMGEHEFISALRSAPKRVRPRSRWERMASYPVTKGSRRYVLTWEGDPLDAERWVQRVMREVGGRLVFSVTENLHGDRIIEWRPR